MRPTKHTLHSLEVRGGDT